MIFYNGFLWDLSALTLDATVQFGNEKAVSLRKFIQEDGHRSEKPHFQQEIFRGTVICNHVTLQSIQVKNSPLAKIWL
jgi:hypothetical protein